MKSTPLIALVIVIAAAAAALVTQNQAQVKLRQENADLRQQFSDQVAALQADNERLSNQVAQASGPRLSQDQLRELVRLRAEVAKLRSQQNQLQSQSGELETLREENHKLREHPTGQPGAPTPPQMDPEAARAACVNNLRAIDTAKQQCAAALNLKITEPISTEQLAPYMKQLPKCPAGGAYSLGPVGFSPTCSVAGHALP